MFGLHYLENYFFKIICLKDMWFFVIFQEVLQDHFPKRYVLASFNEVMWPKPIAIIKDVPYHLKGYIYLYKLLILFNLYAKKVWS